MLLKRWIMILVFYILRVFPIKKNKIVICSYLGQGYGDNGKYIVEELLKHPCQYDIVWLSNNPSDTFPAGVRSVKYGSMRCMYELATAKVWIDNRRKPGFVRKRKDQFYIMTWHSGIALKQVEKDAESSLPKDYVYAAKNDSKMANLMLANSAWGVNRFRRAFWYDGEIAEYGQPREDFLYNYTDAQRLAIRHKIGVEDDQRLLLYAPTFRKSRSEESLKVYQLEWSILLENISSQLGGKWVGGLRLHPNVAHLEKELKCESQVRSLTSYPDMQELLVACDAMITDYSSCMFDSLLLEKPTFLYASDMTEYWHDRKFYFSLDELPFSVAQSQEELNRNILDFSMSKFSEGRRQFYENVGLAPGGKAAEKTANRIRKEIYGVES